ncbi:MAG: anti-sigma F factor antagonist [Dethiobacteria bacterium]|jgi:stage II sporulation protein AA (anti-sigma F factor antagonist)|nr:anti-sigma F factor antagonist [Bacillota bacterium]NMD33221.1 anti-sigma F factor antagonist [Bacillota bacterium]HOB28372.1 anti-sigma F factor antagonist [Bacillota bacterium]HPZ41250.1 anti-sigma F factor antagonist [Bacillota bacterium]HQD51921.1 anti-sigma F factor antagonist [Bacillota bacterium]
MEIEFNLHHSILLVRLKGELDHHWAEQMREKVDRELVRHLADSLLFNLGGLTFMDSSGVGALLGRYRKISAKGGRMVICEAPPVIFKITEISGLARIIPFFEREADALQHLILGAPPKRRS